METIGNPFDRFKATFDASEDAYTKVDIEADDIAYGDDERLNPSQVERLEYLWAEKRRLTAESVATLKAERERIAPTEGEDPRRADGRAWIDSMLNALQTRSDSDHEVDTPRPA